MELKGIIKEIGSTQQISESFKKRDIIIEYAPNPAYPEYVKFETHQDKTSFLDSLKAGDEVEVHFNLKGKPWTNKDGITSYFNSLVIWRVNVVGAQKSAPEYAAPDDFHPSNPGEDDDLPF